MDDKKLLTVKAFAALSGLEQSTLRYWDEIGLFSPARRNEDNGYRYYTPAQMIAVNYIKVMSSLNIPLKVIRAVADIRTPENMLELLEEQELRLDAELRRVRDNYAVVHTLRGLIHQGLKADEPALSVSPLDEQPIILGPKNVFGQDECFYEAFMQFCEKAKRRRINLNYPVGGYYESAESFMRMPHQPTRFFSIDPSGHDKRPAGPYLVGYTRGYYGHMGDLPARMAAYAQENHLRFTGPLYVAYVLDEICVREPTQYLAKVTARVKADAGAPDSSTRR